MHTGSSTNLSNATHHIAEAVAIQVELFGGLNQLGNITLVAHHAEADAELVGEGGSHFRGLQECERSACEEMPHTSLCD